MNRLDISDWKEFKIAELFDINPTRYHKLINKDLFDEEGKNPVVVNSSYNNGIGGYSSCECTEQGNTITFSDTTTADSIFYQSNDFVGYSHVQKLVPIIYKDKWTKNCLLFFMIVFRAKAKLMNFDYVNKFTRENALNLLIKLPVKNNIPDWEYMENHIECLYLIERDSLSTIANYINNPLEKNISLNGWTRFHLYDNEMFDIDMGTKLDKIKMTSVNPTINFIGRANKSNGITEFVDEISGLKPYEAGNLTLSLGGEYLGSCFIQPSPFYTSQNVVVLKPKWQMSFNVKMFISIMVFKESRLYYKAFVDELNRHIKTDFSIYLPTKNDAPDWQYMEDYISYLFQQQSNTLQHLV